MFSLPQLSGLGVPPPVFMVEIKVLSLCPFFNCIIISSPIGSRSACLHVMSFFLFIHRAILLLFCFPSPFVHIDHPILNLFVRVKFYGIFFRFAIVCLVDCIPIVRSTSSLAASCVIHRCHLQPHDFLMLRFVHFSLFLSCRLRLLGTSPCKRRVDGSHPSSHELYHPCSSSSQRRFSIHRYASIYFCWFSVIPSGISFCFLFVLSRNTNEISFQQYPFLLLMVH